MTDKRCYERIKAAFRLNHLFWLQRYVPQQMQQDKTESGFSCLAAAASIIQGCLTAVERMAAFTPHQPTKLV